jgi:hypothetical protein
MTGYTNPLKHVRVAAPCPADWDRMRGDERVRFCDQCSLNVYNLSGMTRREAEALLTQAEGRLCVRFYRRRDGTILTNNCPVGLRALKRRASKVASATLSAVVSFFAGLGIMSGFDLYRSLMPDATIGDTVEDYPMMGTMTAEPPAVRSVPKAGQVAVNDSGWVNGRMALSSITEGSPHHHANAGRR